MAFKFDAVPDELKQYAQFVVWCYEFRNENTKPTKVPYSPISMYPAAVTEPAHWGTFENALTAMQSGYFAGIGFVFTANDPFAFVDLDDAKGVQENVDLHMDVFNKLETYSEVSPSGTGLHIICKGAVPRGINRRKKAIEIYSNERFMTVTGNSFRNLPIVDCNDLLNSLWEFLGGSEYEPNAYFAGQEQKEDDHTIINRALSARNGYAFQKLMNGDWASDFQSQSEADQALINIIQFYTKNSEQIKRIFWMSALGQRQKAKNNRYLNSTIKLSFDREMPTVDIEPLRQKIAAVLEKPQGETVPMQDVHTVPGLFNGERFKPAPQKQIAMPPGIVGRLAKAIYDMAPYPVAEVAVTAALGLFAGIAGRAFNFQRLGLNQYLVLLAETSVGKDMLVSGPGNIIKALSYAMPVAANFIGPSMFASSQALIKRLAKQPSFLCVVDEFGRRMKEWINPRSHNNALITTLLELFTMSSNGSRYQGMAYSDSDKDVPIIEAPALTFIGASQPHVFYEAINEELFSNGFIPRMTVIEYKGDRPYPNESPLNITECKDLLTELANIVAYCTSLNARNQIVEVSIDQESKDILKRFRAYCDSKIRGRKGVPREAWTRAHVKASKLAALLAVGMNAGQPQINREALQWAIDLEVENAERLCEKHEQGEIGEKMEAEEHRQIQDISQTIKLWLTSKWEDLQKYQAGTYQMHAAKVVPYKFLNKKLACIASFRKDKLGATRAIQRALRVLEDSGDLQATKNREIFQSNALVYAVHNPEAFI